MSVQPDFHHIDSAAYTPAEMLALRRNVERIHKLGDRALYELLLELARDLGPRKAPWLLKRIEAYAAIDPEILAALGGDRAPAAPLRLVR
jgi:hypothetical protein